MLKSSIIIVLGIILVIVNAVIIKTRYLAQSRLSNNGLKFMALILCTLLSIVCGLIAIADGITVRNLWQYIESLGPLAVSVSLHQKAIKFTNLITIAIVTGYISLILSYLSFYSIQKELKTQLLQQSKKTWDLDKIN